MHKSIVPDHNDMVFEKTYDAPVHRRYHAFDEGGTVVCILTKGLRECSEQIVAAIEAIITEHIASKDSALERAHAAQRAAFPHKYDKDGMPKPDPAYAISEDEESERRRYWHGRGTAY